MSREITVRNKKYYAGKEIERGGRRKRNKKCPE